jgi:hypothetical protein
MLTSHTSKHEYHTGLAHELSNMNCEGTAMNCNSSHIQQTCSFTDIQINFHSLTYKYMFHSDTNKWSHTNKWSTQIQINGPPTNNGHIQINGPLRYK